MIKKTVKHKVVFILLIIVSFLLMLIGYYISILIALKNINDTTDLLFLPEIQSLIVCFIQSLLSCTVTLIALFFTVFSQDNQTAMQIRNSTLLSVRPCIFIEAQGAVSYNRDGNSESIIKNNGEYIIFIGKKKGTDTGTYNIRYVNVLIYNLGNNLARNITISNNDSIYPDIRNNSHINAMIIYYNLDSNNTDISEKIEICFEDIYGYKYKQIFNFSTISKRALIKSTEPMLERKLENGTENQRQKKHSTCSGKKQ